LKQFHGAPALAHVEKDLYGLATSPAREKQIAALSSTLFLLASLAPTGLPSALIKRNSVWPA